MSIIDNAIPFITAHYDDIAAVAALIGGWLWHKARGEKTKTIREILDDVVDQVLASDGVDLENVKERAEAMLRAALAKAHVTGKAADVLAHEFTEYAAGELARRFQLLERNWKKLQEAVDRADKGMADAFAKAGA